MGYYLEKIARTRLLPFTKILPAKRNVAFSVSWRAIPCKSLAHQLRAAFAAGAELQFTQRDSKVYLGTYGQPHQQHQLDGSVIHGLPARVASSSARCNFGGDTDDGITCAATIAGVYEN